MRRPRIRFRLDDRLLPGEQLPSLRDLTAERNVSVATVWKAHAPPQADGLMLAQERLCQHLRSLFCGEVSGGVRRVGQTV